MLENDLRQIKSLTPCKCLKVIPEEKKYFKNDLVQGCEGFSFAWGHSGSTFLCSRMTSEHLRGMGQFKLVFHSPPQLSAKRWNKFGYDM